MFTVIEIWLKQDSGSDMIVMSENARKKKDDAQLNTVNSTNSEVEFFVC